jgi:hypothetical protein
VAQLSKEMEVVKLIVVEANRKSGLQAEEIKVGWLLFRLL